MFLLTTLTKKGYQAILNNITMLLINYTKYYLRVFINVIGQHGM